MKKLSDIMNLDKTKGRLPSAIKKILALPPDKRAEHFKKAEKLNNEKYPNRNIVKHIKTWQEKVDNDGKTKWVTRKKEVLYRWEKKDGKDILVRLDKVVPPIDKETTDFQQEIKEIYNK